MAERAEPSDFAHLSEEERKILLQVVEVLRRINFGTVLLIVQDGKGGADRDGGEVPAAMRGQSSRGGGAVFSGEMCWQAECWRDLDRMRAQLREDLGAQRGGKIPLPVRLGTWGGVVLGAAAVGEPVVAVLGVVLFEAFLAPHLRRRPPPTIGPLVPWSPPESYRESPEAPAPWALRDG